MSTIRFQSGIPCPGCDNTTAQVIGDAARVTRYRCPRCAREWRPGLLAAIGRALTSLALGCLAMAA